MPYEKGGKALFVKTATAMPVRRELTIFYTNSSFNAYELDNSHENKVNS